MRVVDNSWLARRDSNPRMLGPEPSALPLGDSPSAKNCQLLNIIIGIRVTFRDPETSRPKTSFRRKISLQTATGSSHPDAGTLGLGALPLGQSPTTGVIISNS